MSQVPTFCRVCEPACGLLARVEGESLVGLRPDRDHPVSKGYACHKGLAGVEVHRDPDRLDTPERRDANGQFARVGWDDALAEIAARLAALRDEHGPEAIGAYIGNPMAFNTFAGPSVGSFLGQLGVRRVYGSGTQDCANKFAAAEAVFGTSTLHPVPDIEHTDHLLLIGENPRVSHMSFFSIADPLGEIKRAVRRGATVRYLNPKRIESEDRGTGEVIQLRPDTDVYVLAAMLQTIFEEGLEDARALDRHGRHVAELRAFVAAYGPERVAPVVGVEAARLRELARDFATARRAAVHMSTGANMGRQGTLAYWLVQVLSLATGNLDREGGNLYSHGFYPAAKAGRTDPARQFFDGPHGRMRRIRGSLPGNLLADEILGGTPRIRALVVIAGNPVLSIGGEARMREALEGLDLLVCLDLYRNATGELADFALPCTDAFERPDVNLTGLGMQYRPYVQWTDAVVPPRAERRPEWWILERLLQELDLKSALDAGPEPDLSGRLAHMLRSRDLSLDDLRESERGVVFEGLEPGRFFEDWIQTEDRRVDCRPTLFLEEGAIDRCEAIFEELLAEDPSALKLITLRTPSMHNSWYHNVEKLKRPGRLSNPLHMNPEDARSRGLAEGDLVTCKSAWGEVEAELRLDDTLRAGTVAMTHGWGHQRAPSMRVAQRHPGTNANRLLPIGPDSFEPLSNQAFMTGIPISVAHSDG